MALVRRDSERRERIAEVYEGYSPDSLSESITLAGVRYAGGRSATVRASADMRVLQDHSNIGSANLCFAVSE